MGLFETKYCSICGEKLAIMGNHKLADGYACKECGRRFSPYFYASKHMTVADVEAHLRYRDENYAALNDFEPTAVYGNGTKIYIDENKQLFVVSRYSNWRETNPDLIPLSAVIGASCEVDDNKKELFRKNSEGKNVPFQPPRYEYAYEFNMRIDLDGMFFSRVDFELTTDRPEEYDSPAYRSYIEQAQEIIYVLTGKEGIIREPDVPVQPVRAAAPARPAGTRPVSAVRPAAQKTPAGGRSGGAAAAGGTVSQAASGRAAGTRPKPEEPTGPWVCVKCKTRNTAKFCSECGSPRPVTICPKCYFKGDPLKPPKFCPECGAKMNEV